MNHMITLESFESIIFIYILPPILLILEKLILSALNITEKWLCGHGKKFEAETEYNQFCSEWFIDGFNCLYYISYKLLYYMNTEQCVPKENQFVRRF